MNVSVNLPVLPWWLWLLLVFATAFAWASGCILASAFWSALGDAARARRS